MVGFEQEVLAKKVDRFGWDRDAGSPAHNRMVTDWMDVLQDYPLPEVQAACRAAISANPNKMPNEGHVKAQILVSRKAMLAAIPKPVEPREDFTPKNEAQKAEADALVSQFARRAGAA